MKALQPSSTRRIQLYAACQDLLTMHSGNPRTTSPAVAIFTRLPSPGRAKTRLIPLLGPQGAARFQAALLQDTLRKTKSLADVARCYLFFDGHKAPTVGAPFKLIRQRGVDLGTRLEDAFRRLLRRHPSAVVIGTDSPLLPTRILRQALRELRICESVLGPCPDGGYYLIGLRGHAPGLLRGVRWGSRFAFEDTLERLLRRSHSCSVLAPFEDVDLASDLRRLKGQLSRSSTARRRAPSVWQFLKSPRRLL